MVARRSGAGSSPLNGVKNPEPFSRLVRFSSECRAPGIFSGDAGSAMAMHLDHVAGELSVVDRIRHRRMLWRADA
jgi:hypothetical protein